MKREKKHKPYEPPIKRTPSQQAAHDSWWAQIVENRKRLRKQRNPQTTGEGGAKVSLADRIAQKREEIQEVCTFIYISYFEFAITSFGGRKSWKIGND